MLPNSAIVGIQTTTTTRQIVKKTPLLTNREAPSAKRSKAVGCVSRGTRTWRPPPSPFERSVRSGGGIRGPLIADARRRLRLLLRVGLPLLLAGSLVDDRP